jgi:hypothetical protein
VEPGPDPHRYDSLALSPPTWVVTPALKIAGAAYRLLDRTLAIQIDTEIALQEKDNPDDYVMDIRVFNGTDHEERLRTLQLTFTGGAPPFPIQVEDDSVVNRLHSYKASIEEFLISAHEQYHSERRHHRVVFNGVRVQFHSGRTVWRPARGFRPASRWFLLKRRWKEWRRRT